MVYYFYTGPLYSSEFPSFFFSFGNPAKGVETLERARTHMGRQPAQAGNRLTEVRRGGKDRTCAAR